MKYSHGIWYWQGKGYRTLMEALVEAEKKLPTGWRTRRGQASKNTYRENRSIIPQENAICKGSCLWNH